jgi:hypothetical protein
MVVLRGIDQRQLLQGRARFQLRPRYIAALLSATLDVVTPLTTYNFFLHRTGARHLEVALQNNSALMPISLMITVDGG